MFRKLLTRLRKPKKSLVITGILPDLKLSCEFLSSSQSVDGSWSNDILTSALVLRALAIFSESTGEKSLFKTEIKSGIEFLKSAINSLSDKILQTEDLYSGLDKTAIDFGNGVFTLWLTRSLENDEFLRKIRSAFLRIESDVAKFIKALNNVEVACSVLNCYMISSFDHPSEQILDFAIAQIFSKDTLPKDAFLLAITLKSLQEKFPSLLEEKWNRQVARRTDNWRDMSLKDGLQKLIIDKSMEIIGEKVTDLTTLSYGLIALSRLGVSTPDLQEKIIDLQEKIIERLLSNRINIWKKEAPLSELSYFVWSLSESPIAKIAFFPFKEKDYVITAIKWYEKMKASKIKMLKSTQYNLLIYFILILICLVAIISYFAFSDLGITLTILSGLLGTFYFLVNWMSKND